MNRTYLYGAIALVVAGVVFFYVNHKKQHLGISPTQMVVSRLDDHQSVNKKAPAKSQQPNTHEAKLHIAHRSPEPAKLPSGNLAANLPSLEARALAGHPEIAYSLAEQLFACYRKSQPSEDPFVTDSSTTFGEKCSGLADSDYQTGVKLLTYAATAGDVNAQNAYVVEVGSWIDHHPELVYQPGYTTTFATNSMNFLHSAAANGNVEAMINLSNAYDMGIITPADRVAAYAYMYSANKTGLVPSTQRLLTIWKSQFSSNEVLMGTRKGDEIFKNCCGGI